MDGNHVETGFTNIIIHTHTRAFAWVLLYKVSGYAELGFLYTEKRFLPRGGSVVLPFFFFVPYNEIQTPSLYHVHLIVLVYYFYKMWETFFFS